MFYKQESVMTRDQLGVPELLQVLRIVMQCVVQKNDSTFEWSGIHA
jgi:hypothetical protein